MPIKPASAKSKGRNLQKWVRDLILRLWPQLEPDDVKSTSMGAGGEDVQLSPAARRLVPLSIECKAHARHAIYSLYGQAVANCPAKAEPALIIKADRQQPLAVVDAEYFFRLLRGE